MTDDEMKREKELAKEVADMREQAGDVVRPWQAGLGPAGKRPPEGDGKGSKENSVSVFPWSR